MKQLTFCFMMLLSFQLTHGQETKSVSKKSIEHKEVYSVLTVDKKIRHGDYKKYEGKNQLIIEGTFDNNRKVGEWKFYVKGELEQTYDFTINQLKYFRKSDDISKVLINGTIQDVKLDTPPLFIGAKVGLNDELNKVMTYPYQAVRMGVAGKVVVSFWVTENGDISDIKVIQGVMNECDNEVIKGLNKIENNWIAGTKNGKKVQAQLFIVIEFELHDNGTKTITVL